MILLCPLTRFHLLIRGPHTRAMCGLSSSAYRSSSSVSYTSESELFSRRQFVSFVVDDENVSMRSVIGCHLYGPLGLSSLAVSDRSPDNVSLTIASVAPRPSEAE